MFLRVLWGLKACMLPQDRVGGLGVFHFCFCVKGVAQKLWQVSRSSTKWRRTV